MTDPRETTSTPAATGPTPEEISARLEALLKRTQALRASQQPVHDPGAPLPWPPPDGELDALELVDVPPPQARPPQPVPVAVADHGQVAQPRPPASTAADAGSVSPFERPDWTSLRLRDPQPAPARTSGWIWLLVAALVVALGAESAYLLHTAPWTASATASPSASLSLEGDQRLRARFDDGEPEPLPVRRAVSAGSQARVVIELVDPGEPGTETAAGSPAAGAAPSLATDTARPTAPIARPATTGAVLIESSPPGALVTMEGRERGRTPLRIDGLRPGRHDVLVAGASGILALKVDVVAGETTRLDASRP